MRSQRYAGPGLDAGAGEPVSFSVPPNEGVWRARADARRRYAPVQRATGFSRFRVSRGPDPSRPGSSRRGCSGVRPRVQLRTTPAGAASRPTITTPHESAPQWTGRVLPKVTFTTSQSAHDDVNNFS